MSADPQALSFEGEPSGEPSATPIAWRANVVLFVLTVASVWYAGAMYTRPGAFASTLLPLDWQAYAEAWKFAVPLLGILLFHEFGHWLAARHHGVRASLPYFIPMPLLSLFGTLGAVIAMPDRIRSRDALMDIGAAGPLGGLLVALPIMAVGLGLSPVEPLSGPYDQEGQSLLYWAFKRLVCGEIPPGHDVLLHATALAAWVGFFVTMINLVPWGQLDGGHIAYALWGNRHHRVARWIRYAMLTLVVFNLVRFGVPVLTGESGLGWGHVAFNSAFWLSWFVITAILGGLFGHEHPPFEPGPLSPSRRAVGWLCLALLVLLFMPTPFARYS